MSVKRRLTVAQKDGLFGLLALSPTLLVIAVFFVVPTVLMLWMSLHDWPMLGVPKFIGAENYLDAFGDESFLRAGIFTLVYVAISTPLVIVLALALASLVRRQRRGTGAFRVIFLLPYVMGFAASAFLWYWLVNDRVGALKAVLLSVGVDINQAEWLAQTVSGTIVVLTMVVWKTVGFYMLLLMSGMHTITEDIYEAARLDGASRWQQFIHVTLPLLRPTIVMVCIFSVTWGLLAFDQFFILTGGRPGGETVTAVFWIYTTSFTRYDLGYGATLSVLIVVALALVAAVQLRWLRDPEESK